MRMIGRAVAWASILVCAYPFAGVAQTVNATTIVGAAREALGGDTNLAAIH